MPPPEKKEGRQVAIKEMTMNRLEFGEVVFGGNLESNLQIESNMNKTITLEKAKNKKKAKKNLANLNSFFGDPEILLK